MVNSNECSVSSSLTGDAIQCSGEKKTIFYQNQLPSRMAAPDPIASLFNFVPRYPT
jgi:hypothetical protein